MYKINSLDHYGRGITEIDDKIAFIENALPDEIVEVKIENETIYIKDLRIQANLPYFIVQKINFQNI